MLMDGIKYRLPGLIVYSEKRSDVYLPRQGRFLQITDFE